VITTCFPGAPPEGYRGRPGAIKKGEVKKGKSKK
jgi:hypothetical protein